MEWTHVCYEAQPTKVCLDLGATFCMHLFQYNENCEVWVACESTYLISLANFSRNYVYIRG